MEQLLILLVGGLIVLVRKLFMEGGLEKILGKLDRDLNQPSEELGRTTPPPLMRPVAQGLDPEQERIRKFREALGMPPEDSLRPTPQTTSSGSAPTPLSPAGRARRERARIERKLEERRSAPSAATTPVPSPQPPQPAQTEPSVARYFDLESFDRPPIEPEQISVAVQVDVPIIEPDFFKTLEKREAASAVPVPRLVEVFGAGTDLRRLILAQEILGRPKSLQNA